MDSFENRLAQAQRFCISRAGTGNGTSTRAFCNCIEHSDGEKLIAELIRRAHTNARLNAGVRLMFAETSIIELAAKFGVDPLPPVPVKEGRKAPRPKKPPAFEVRFLEQVRGLVATSNRALEEAEQYAEKITDPTLKEQAQRLLDL